MSHADNPRSAPTTGKRQTVSRHAGTAVVLKGNIIAGARAAMPPARGLRLAAMRQTLFDLPMAPKQNLLWSGSRKLTNGSLAPPIEL